MKVNRKLTNREDTNASQLHFAVAPYKVEYETPVEDLYLFMFEKGFQVIGEMIEPIENLNRSKELGINFSENIFAFRILSERNCDYQWSLYINKDQMQELLESKSISFRETIKNTHSNRVASEYLVENRSVKFDQSKITLHFYVFCAFSANDLSEAVNMKKSEKNTQEAVPEGKDTQQALKQSEHSIRIESEVPQENQNNSLLDGQQQPQQDNQILEAEKFAQPQDTSPEAVAKPIQQSNEKSNGEAHKITAQNGEAADNNRKCSASEQQFDSMVLKMAQTIEAQGENQPIDIPTGVQKASIPTPTDLNIQNEDTQGQGNEQSQSLVNGELQPQPEAQQQSAQPGNETPQPEAQPHEVSGKQIQPENVYFQQPISQTINPSSETTPDLPQASPVIAQLKSNKKVILLIIVIALVYLLGHFGVFEQFGKAEKKIGKSKKGKLSKKKNQLD